MRSQGTKVALVATAILTGTVVKSQDDAGGVRFLFGVSSSLRTNSNLDLDPVSAGPTTRSDTRLTFGVQSETRRQKLALTFGAVLRAENRPGSGFSTGIAEPGIDLSYSREDANARMSFEASFDRSDIDRTDPLAEDEIDLTDLITDTGTRDRFRTGVMLETGLQAPLGFKLELDRQDTRYADTTDPGLYDRTTDSASATALLRFSTRTEGWATASFSRYAAEDATMTTRDTRALSFGVKHELSQSTVIETSIGAREIDDSVTGVMRNSEASLSLTHALPRGSVALSLDSELTSAGQQNTVEVERGFEFPGGTFQISLGAVDAEGVDPQAIGSLSFRRDLPSGALTALLSRGVSVNDDAQAQRVTRAVFGLTHTVNNLSSVSFNLDYADISDAGTGGIVELQRGSLRAAYTRALNNDWNFSAGYERRYLTEAGIGTAWDNAVFVTLDRSFSLLH